MKKSISDKVLYPIIAAVIKFYTGSTREWAAETVEKLEGSKVRETTLKEANRIANNSEFKNIIFHRRGDEEDDIVKIFAGDERQIGLTALVIALKYRLKQYLVIPVALVILYLLVPSEIESGSVGIYFDLFGAVIITRGLFRTPSEITAQSMMTAPTEPLNNHFNPLGDPVKRLVLAVETVDSMLGSMLLVLGFSLQLLPEKGISFVAGLSLFTMIIWTVIRQ